MNFKMARGYTLRFYFYFVFIALSVTGSLQLTSDGKDGKGCSCYKHCQKNFSANSINYDQTKEACQRGCRFFSLLLHATHNELADYEHTKEGCIKSCKEGYTNPVEISSCNYGCTSIKPTEPCDVMEHQLPQITYALVIEESDVLIHPGDPDPDDVLIDPGLKKQIEKTLESFLDPKPKLPEIHFRNLPITNKETTPDHPRTTFKCPKFYGFDSKLEFRNGKITTSDLLFLFSLSVFAMICFVVSRNLEKQRKLWKQLLTNLLHSKPTLMKIKDNFMKEEPLLDEDYPEKSDPKESDEEMMDTVNEKIDSKFDGITLVFYDNEDEEYERRNGAQPNQHNNINYP